MADRSPDADEPDDASTGVPRWVKAAALIALLLVAALVISLLAGVEHGPGRHAEAADRATLTVSTA